MIQKDLFDDILSGHRDKKHYLFHLLKDLGFKPLFNKLGNIYCKSDFHSAIYFTNRIKLMTGIDGYTISDYDGKSCQIEFTNNIPWVDPSFKTATLPITGIYLLTNKINGKQYVGQSNNIFRRWIHHKHSVNWKQTHKHTLIIAAIKKYGISNFSFEIIDIVPDANKDKLNELEIKYIQEYHTYVDDPLGKNHGYNLTKGGNEKRSVSLETRKKQRLAKLGKPSIRKGAKISDESREKMRISASKRKRVRGYTFSISAKQNIKNANIKRSLYGNTANCVRISLDGETNWFVNEKEASRFYIETNKGYRIIQGKATNSNFAPVSIKQERSKGWQKLKDAVVSYCSLEELLEHRPELQLGQNSSIKLS
jgi:group I intron endonuclease